MASKAAKRRAKKRTISLHGSEDVPMRPTGRDRRHTNQQQDASAATLKTRCRQIGQPHTEDGIREARAPWYGCNAGRAMAAAVCADDRAGLWDAICHMRKTVARYDAAIGAPRRHAVCLRLLAPLDVMEATADSPASDDRPEAERHASAVSGWMAMHGWLGWVDKPAASQALAVVVDDARVTDADGLVLALRCVSDGIKGNPMKYRGRESLPG